MLAGPHEEQEHIGRGQLQASRRWQVEASAIGDDRAYARTTRRVLRSPETRAVVLRRVHQQRAVNQARIGPEPRMRCAEHAARTNAQPAHHRMRTRPDRAPDPRDAPSLARTVAFVVQERLPRQMDERIERRTPRARAIIVMPPFVHAAPRQPTAKCAVNRRPIRWHSR